MSEISNPAAIEEHNKMIREKFPNASTEYTSQDGKITSSGYDKDALKTVTNGSNKFDNLPKVTTAGPPRKEKRKYGNVPE